MSHNDDRPVVIGTATSRDGKTRDITKIQSGNGDDHYYEWTVSDQDTVRINTAGIGGDNRDNVHVHGSNSADIRTQEGADLVCLHGVKNAFVHTGADNDIVEIFSNTKGSIFLGNGNDQAVIRRTSLNPLVTDPKGRGMDLNINGGAGNDSLRFIRLEGQTTPSASQLFLTSNADGTFTLSDKSGTSKVNLNGIEELRMDDRIYNLNDIQGTPLKHVQLSTLASAPERNR